VAGVRRARWSTEVRGRRDGGGSGREIGPSAPAGLLLTGAQGAQAHGDQGIGAQLVAGLLRSGYQASGPGRGVAHGGTRFLICFGHPLTCLIPGAGQFLSGLCICCREVLGGCAFRLVAAQDLQDLCSGFGSQLIGHRLSLVQNPGSLRPDVGQGRAGR